MILIIKIIIDIICGGLNSLGGHGYLYCRRYIMPIVIGAGISIASGTWWLGLCSLPVMGTLCLGYFGKKFWGRGSWLALQAAVIGLAPTLLHHLAWYFYGPYMIVTLLLAGFLYDLDQIIGDIIFGYWIGSIILLVK